MSIKVGVDIGHGSDTWAKGGGKGVKVNGVVYHEHDFNSKVGIIVNRRLQDHGFTVVLGQLANSKDVPLATRTQKYIKEQCKAVVSIHGNAGASTAKGGSAFYWHNSTGSKKLADLFMKHFLADQKFVGKYNLGSIPSKSGTWTDFHMTRVPVSNGIPSILIEAGFMTNSSDFQAIFGKHQTEYVRIVAEATVKAVCEYFGVKYKAVNTTPTNPVPVAPTPAPQPPKETGVKPMGYQPNNGTLMNLTKDLLADMQDKSKHGEKAISEVHLQSLNKGELTTDQLVGLIVLGIRRKMF